MRETEIFGEDRFKFFEVLLFLIGETKWIMDLMKEERAKVTKKRRRDITDTRKAGVLG